MLTSPRKGYEDKFTEFIFEMFSPFACRLAQGKATGLSEHRHHVMMPYRGCICTALLILNLGSTGGGGEEWDTFSFKYYHNHHHLLLLHGQSGMF